MQITPIRSSVVHSSKQDLCAMDTTAFYSPNFCPSSLTWQTRLCHDAEICDTKCYCSWSPSSTLIDFASETGTDENQNIFTNWTQFLGTTVSRSHLRFLCLRRGNAVSLYLLDWLKGSFKILRLKLKSALRANS